MKPDFTQTLDHGVRETLIVSNALTGFIVTNIHPRKIDIGNRTEWSPMQSVIMQVINKWDNCKVGV